MANIIVKDGVLVTMDSERRILESHSIAIEDGRIVEIGKSADLERTHRSAEVLDASGCIVMPGSCVLWSVHSPRDVIQNSLNTVRT